jgi:hypothetical protein
LNEIWFVDAMAGFFLVHHILDETGNIVVGGAVAHQVAHVMLVEGEKAGAQFAIGSDSNAAALPAKWD